MKTPYSSWGGIKYPSHHAHFITETLLVLRNVASSLAWGEHINTYTKQSDFDFFSWDDVYAQESQVAKQSMEWLCANQ